MNANVNFLQDVLSQFFVAVFYSLGLNHIHDIFGYIGGVVTDTLEMAGNKKQWHCAAGTGGFTAPLLSKLAQNK